MRKLSKAEQTMLHVAALTGGIVGDLTSSVPHSRSHQVDFDRMHVESKKTGAHLRSVGLAMNERGEQIKGDTTRPFAMVRKASPVRAANRARRRREGW